MLEVKNEKYFQNSSERKKKNLIISRIYSYKKSVQSSRVEERCVYKNVSANKSEFLVKILQRLLPIARARRGDNNIAKERIYSVTLPLKRVEDGLFTHSSSSKQPIHAAAIVTAKSRLMYTHARSLAQESMSPVCYSRIVTHCPSKQRILYSRPSLNYCNFNNI